MCSCVAKLVGCFHMEQKTCCFGLKSKNLVVFFLKNIEFLYLCFWNYVWNKAFLLGTYLFTLEKHYLYLSFEKRLLKGIASNDPLKQI